jgi:hypothetical protein
MLPGQGKIGQISGHFCGNGLLQPLNIDLKDAAHLENPACS